MATRVLIVDDHEVVRLGLCRTLDQQESLEVVGQACNGLEAIDMVAQLVPDVVVIDIAMPMLNGIDAARRIKKDHQETKIVALSMNSTRQFILDMLEAGADAYLLKTDAIDDVVSAIEAAMRGEVYLTPKIAAVVTQECLSRGAQGSEQEGSANELTARERQVLQLLAEGHSSKEIGNILGMEQNTVMVHRRHVMNKLGLHSVAELTKYAIQQGITSLQS